ncbi:hypothetical protein SLA2020_322540 [Shorea laevis]
MFSKTISVPKVSSELQIAKWEETNKLRTSFRGGSGNSPSQEKEVNQKEPHFTVLQIQPEKRKVKQSIKNHFQCPCSCWLCITISELISRVPPGLVFFKVHLLFKFPRI